MEQSTERAEGPLILPSSVKPKSTWALLKPHFETLVSQYVFPQLSFTPEKQELWESDPVDFVRVSIDEYEDFAAPVSAATSFLLALAGNRTKTTFMPILGIINHALTSDVPPQQKYAALNMTSVLGGLMMRHPQVRPNIEQFLVQHVFPEFSNTMPYMRAIACEVLATVEKNDMKWANDENLAAASRFIATALNDPEIPVRVQAALALTEMITSHESVENAVRGDVGKVVQDLLKLSDETDLDILNNCMETMVERYHAELLPVATQLAARLCDTYIRLLNESIKQEESMDSENDFDKGFDSDAGDDDKTFAAMGVAKTIGTIISSVESSPEILAQVEAVVSPIIIFTLEHKIIDLFDNVYDLIDALTFNLRRITPAQWKIFELTYNLFKADAIDFLDEMLPSLDNFISYGSDAIKANPEYKMMILDIYTTAMTADQLGENDRVDACKLIESFLLNLRGEVNDAIERIVVISFKELETASSRSLQLAILETLINVILYNPSAGLHIMETVDSNKTRKFFDKWFAAIKSKDGLPRVHDKKLTIMTLCALLELDPAAVPASLQSGWSGIVSAIIHVLKELPEAVEKRKTLEDAFVKGDDDEDDVEESELLNLTDDEDGDVRDEETDYIELLAQEGARLRQTAPKSADDADAESYEESEDEEEIDEELGYISPLEKVDPYVTFKQALTGLQTRNPAGYQVATTSLTVEEQTALMEMMAIAEKNASGAL